MTLVMNHKKTPLCVEGNSIALIIDGIMLMLDPDASCIAEWVICGKEPLIEFNLPLFKSGTA